MPMCLTSELFLQIQVSALYECYHWRRSAAALYSSWGGQSASNSALENERTDSRPLEQRTLEQKPDQCTVV